MVTQENFYERTIFYSVITFMTSRPMLTSLSNCAEGGLENGRRLRVSSLIRKLTFESRRIDSYTGGQGRISTAWDTRSEPRDACDHGAATSPRLYANERSTGRKGWVREPAERVRTTSALPCLMVRHSRPHKSGRKFRPSYTARDRLLRDARADSFTYDVPLRSRRNYQIVASPCTFIRNGCIE